MKHCQPSNSYILAEVHTQGVRSREEIEDISPKAQLYINEENIFDKNKHQNETIGEEKNW